MLNSLHVYVYNIFLELNDKNKELKIASKCLSHNTMIADCLKTDLQALLGKKCNSV
jgi:hypothetical protein